MAEAVDPKAGEGGDAGAEHGDTDTGAEKKAGNAGTGAAEGTTGKALSLTQDELDAIVEGRLAKERRGHASQAEKAAKYDELMAAQQTDAEKATAKQAEREAGIAKREAAANEMLIRASCLAAVRGESIEAEFEDLVVDALMGADGVEVSDDGEVVGVKEALKAMIAKKPKLKAAKAAAGTTQRNGAEFGGQSGKTVDEKIAEAEGKGSKGVLESIRLKAEKYRAAAPGS